MHGLSNVVRLKTSCEPLWTQHKKIGNHINRWSLWWCCCFPVVVNVDTNVDVEKCCVENDWLHFICYFQSPSAVLFCYLSRWRAARNPSIISMSRTDSTVSMSSFTDANAPSPTTTCPRLYNSKDCVLIKAQTWTITQNITFPFPDRSDTKAGQGGYSLWFYDTDHVSF